MQTLYDQPALTFNPVMLDGESTSFSDITLKLRIISRTCNLDYKNKVASFCLTLQDNSGNEFTIPCKYFVWLGAEQCNTLTCVCRSVQGKPIYNLLEITELDKPNLETKDFVENPVSKGNSYIMEQYIPVKYEHCVVQRLYNKVKGNIVVPMVTAYLHDNTYVRGTLALKYLKETAPLTISYRELIIEGVVFRTDMEGVV